MEKNNSKGLKLALVTIILCVIVVSQIEVQDSKKDKPSQVEITSEAKKSIEKGINWLLTAQNKDGSWGADIGHSGDITVTCVATLALIAEGSAFGRGKYGEAINKGVKYVLRHAKEMKSNIYTGEVTLVQNKLGKNIHTYMTGIFFGQALGMQRDIETDDEIRQSLKKITSVIIQFQKEDGGWGETTFSTSLTTASAWLALRSAYSAGISVKNSSCEKVMNYLKKHHMPGSGPDYGDFYNLCSAIRVLYGMGEGKTDLVKKLTEQLLKTNLATVYGGSWGGEEYLAAFYATQALIHENGENWKKWFPYVRERLIKIQNADGSWTGSHCITHRTFCTATALLTLQTPYRLLPLIQY